MKRFAIPSLVALGALSCASEPDEEPAQLSGGLHTTPESETRAIFDGATLAGWDGDPRFWSVENAAIVGRSTPSNPCNDTTYLVWRGGEVGDFELRCEFRIRGGNSGVQFRSRDQGNWHVAGYQADIEDGSSWTGCLYEQDGRGVIATRGQQVVLGGPAPEKTQFGDAGELLARVRAHDWNEYSIRAVGDLLELAINGARTCEVIDLDPARRSRRGLLALQLHAGAPMEVEFRNLRLEALGEGSSTPPPIASPPVATPVPTVVPSPGEPPQWIWTRAEAADGERAAFFRAFELPAGATRTTLRGAGDNRIRVFVNGSLAADTDEWWKPVEVDVTALVRSGGNEVVIAGENESSVAAVWVELVVESGDKRSLRLLTDGSWSTVALGGDGSLEEWTPARFDRAHASPPHVFGPFGCDPWGALGEMMNGGAASAASEPDEQALAASELELLDGFSAELLYSVPKSSQGSWVSLCEDLRGRLYASDQYGGLYRITPPLLDGDAAQTRVERVDVDIGGAHGLCWAFDSLYAIVAEGGEPGLYRLRDTDGDDQLELAVQLRKFDGSGEHGPHGVVLGPDQKLWIVGGNHTKLPEPIDVYRLPRTWGEDHLLPVIEDPNGHAVGIRAPGGWVVRTDEDAQHWELWAGGFRNAYDIAFDPEGELFTYDSDMEWDIGAPWYKPPRILHVVSGADFGWRSGTANWRIDYPDTLPSVCETGPASPTGVVFGTDAKFPAKYRRALYALDWAYGTIYAVQLRYTSSGVTGELEKFITGKPFPVTDIVIARDGAMYVTTGGRRTQSGLYRIAWTRPIEDDEPVPMDIGFDRLPVYDDRDRDLHDPHAEIRPAYVANIVGRLNDPSPIAVQVARVALEQHDPGLWSEAFDRETDPVRATQLVIAALHSAPFAMRERIIAKLDAIPLERPVHRYALGVLRAYQLALIRLSPIDESTLAAWRTRLDAIFPAQAEDVDRQLGELLAFLEAPSVIEKCLDLTANASTQEERLHYLYCLRAMKTGWTIDQRRRFFTAMNDLVATAEGGFSLTQYAEIIRDQAAATLTEDERREVGDLVAPPKPAGAAATEAAAFVQKWTSQDLLAELREPLHDRSFERGKSAYAKSACSQCHRIAGEGGATGPDLTSASSRFSRADLLEALLEPSKAIPDQYQDTEILTIDGDFYVGRIERDDARGIALRRLPPGGELVELDASEIESRRQHPLSRMPSGLLEVLTKDEILDLFAYVLSGASADDSAFAPRR